MIDFSNSEFNETIFTLLIKISEFLFLAAVTSSGH